MYSPAINDRNINNIRSQVNMKNLPAPWLATTKEGSGVLTDYDVFPYQRWFKGVYYSENPVIAEREAGWRPRQDDCYRLKSPCNGDQKIQYPNHCFQTACSTVFPCYPEYLQKISDKDELDLILNKACVVQYR